MVMTNTQDEIRLNLALQRGLREIADGDTRPARDVFAELREEYGIDRDTNHPIPVK